MRGYRSVSLVSKAATCSFERNGYTMKVTVDQVLEPFGISQYVRTVPKIDNIPVRSIQLRLCE